MAKGTGVIKTLGINERTFYSVADVMEMFQVSRSKASQMIQNTRKECIQKGCGVDYPEGKCPKRAFNKRYMID